MGAPDHPSVTLILPIRNEAAHIEASLRSALEQSYPADRLDVIVVDGDSTDATVAVVERLAATDRRIRLLRNPRRSMPHGLNLGIEAATGELVGVVSGHSVVPGDYVARCVEAMERTGAWSVGGRIMRVATEPMQRAIAVATASPVGVGDSRHNYAETAGWVESAFPGFWRRELFDSIGLFDPAMVANEDNELSYRIHAAGGQVWYEPRIAVKYVPRSTLRGLFRQYRAYGRGKLRVLRKHGRGLRWRHLVPGAWIGWLVLGGATALLVPGATLVWLAGISAYALVVVTSSLRLARPGVAWWRIAAALLAMHTGYGIGTWQGLPDLLRPRADEVRDRHQPSS